MHEERAFCTGEEEGEGQAPQGRGEEVCSVLRRTMRELSGV